MSKCKYNFSKKELERLYKEHGSYSKAAKALGVSKTTFMQQYRKSIGQCIICPNEIPSGHNNYTCLECLDKSRIEDKPSSKTCEYCPRTIHRKESQSKLSWSKKKGCDNCLETRSKASLKVTKEKYRHKYNKSIRESDRTHKYQKAYRESERGRIKRRISNARRRANKRATSSLEVDVYIQSLYDDKDCKCPYCSSKDNLSIDHINPLSRGGTHTEDNIELVCLPCNIQKGNKTKDEYMKFLKSIKVEV